MSRFRLLRRAPSRRDAAEPAIVEALEAVGARVWRLVNPFDLLVGYRGALTLLEVKTTARVRKDQAEQTAELEACQRDGLPVFRVQTPQAALEAIGAVALSSAKLPAALVTRQAARILKEAMR